MLNRDNRDKYLQKNYGISLADYEERLSEQAGVCKICGNPPKTKSLSVDHDHKWKRLRIAVWKEDPRYMSVVEGPPSQGYARRYFGAVGSGNTRKEAASDLRGQLQRLSVRGLICFRCNRGLQFYSDDPICLENAAEYLRQHQEDV